MEPTTSSSDDVLVTVGLKNNHRLSHYCCDQLCAKTHFGKKLEFLFNICRISPGSASNV